MSILKNFVNPWGLDTGVLDTDVLETSVLETSVLETSVLDSINGGGGKIIVFTEDGKELHRMQGDGIENAIVVMSNKHMKNFNYLKNALLKKLNTGEISKEVYNSYFDSKNVHVMYRGHGISYMVDGMFNMLKYSRSINLGNPSTVKNFTGVAWTKPNSDKYILMHPEVVFTMSVTTQYNWGSAVVVDGTKKDWFVSTYPDRNRGMDTMELSIHTHPMGVLGDLQEYQVENGKIMPGYPAYNFGGEKEEPSETDWNNRKKQKEYPELVDYYDAVIGPKYIHLYKFDDTSKNKILISVPTSFFNNKK
jgi:hypothetical protein